MPLDPSHRARLTERSAVHFTGDTLFDEVARAVCKAGVLPRKELYESWELARRARRHLKGGRVVDLACGHGLVGPLMLLLDPRSPAALGVDARVPKSAAPVLAAMTARFPQLEGRVTLVEGDLDEVDIGAGDLVVSAHACGHLTDRVIARAVDARASVAVLPCCHPLSSEDARAWPGWVDGALAMDLRRAYRLELAGYRVWTRAIPEEITPKNRLLLGAPR